MTPPRGRTPRHRAARIPAARAARPRQRRGSRLLAASTLAAAAEIMAASAFGAASALGAGSMLGAASLLVVLASGDARAAPHPFLCYRSKTVAGTARFEARPGVGLRDRFGARSVHVFREERLCLPADTDGDPTAPADPAHLAAYQLRKVAPHVDRLHDVAVASALGTLNLDLVKLDRLLVPTAKSRVAPPPAPVAPAVDHFACYKARVTGGTPPFTKAAGLAVTDQLGTVILDVTAPRKLCVPLDVEGTIPGAEAHPDVLLCYRAGTAQGTPPFARVSPLFTHDRFGPLTVDARRPEELCLPALLVD